jgi:hypothetical protein
MAGADRSSSAAMASGVEPPSLSREASSRKPVLSRVLSDIVNPSEYERVASIMRRHPPYVALGMLAKEADGRHALALCDVVGGSRDGAVLLAWLPLDRAGVGEPLGTFLGHSYFTAADVTADGGVAKFNPPAIGPATEQEIEAWSAANDAGPPNGPAIETGWAGARVRLAVPLVLD